MSRFKTIFDTYHEKQGYTFNEPSLTVQAEEPNCNINSIMARYATQGILPPTNGATPQYADVSNIGDYMECLQVVQNAQNAFDSLPSALRKELDNNPANLVSFIQDPANKERCVEYGLINNQVVETPKVVVDPVCPANSDSLCVGNN